MKKILSFSLILGVVALALSSCSSPGSIANNPSGLPSVITVSGYGEVYVVPDIGYINVGVRSQGATVSEAIAVNNDLAKSIRATLLEKGVEDEDIQTSNFNVYQQSDYDFQGQPTESYYVVENTVYITVRKIDGLGEILDAVARGGANNIYGVNFDVSDDSEALSSARVLAVQSAQTQAQELAAAAGVELGDLISINTSLTSTYPNFGYGMGGGGAAMESVPIAAGQISVTTQVEMTFAIK